MKKLLSFRPHIHSWGALLLCLIFALTISSGALAEDYDYSATTCHNYFTTSGYVEKESENSWDYILIVATAGGISFSPSLPSGSTIYQNVCAIAGSGVRVGSNVKVYPGFTGSAMGGWYSVPISNSSTANSYNKLRVRIFNPYGSSYNMSTSGTVRINWN